VIGFLFAAARILAELVGWVTIVVVIVRSVRDARLKGKRERIKAVIAAGFARDIANGSRWTGPFAVDLLGESWLVDLDPASEHPAFTWTKL